MEGAVRALLITVVMALVAAGCGAGNHQGVDRRASGLHLERARQGCPAVTREVGLEDIATTEKIVAAIRRGVPRIFRNYTTQGGGPGWHHYQVLGLFSLNYGYGPSVPGIERYRREAVRRCGRGVGRGSWVVFLQFPEGPAASLSFAHIFVAKTRHGWTAWR